MASASDGTAQGCKALTEKEKQNLRLIVRGHDAKSTARELGLSVHTINERLRDARRKLGVSSSREASRKLLDAEGLTPEMSADEQLGEASNGGPMAGRSAGIERAPRAAWTLIGVTAMTALLVILALAAQPQIAKTAGPPPAPGSIPSASPASQHIVEQAARQWLAVVDAAQWNESWAATGAAFRKLNTVEAWTRASEQARVPQGAVRSRTLLTHDTMPAPPHGYDVVRFRTDFADNPAAIETVTLEREAGGWKVVGYLID